MFKFKLPWLENAFPVLSSFKRRAKSLVIWLKGVRVRHPNLLFPCPLSPPALCPALSVPVSSLARRTLWCLPAQVPVTPASPRSPQSHWSWLLAPAVAACAHCRPPARSLSRPIYLTQTGASRPGPAYLRSAGFSLWLQQQTGVIPPWQL